MGLGFWGSHLLLLLLLLQSSRSFHLGLISCEVLLEAPCDPFFLDNNAQLFFAVSQRSWLPHLTAHMRLTCCRILLTCRACKSSLPPASTTVFVTKPCQISRGVSSQHSDKKSHGSLALARC
jgi:hypothetical protein